MSAVANRLHNTLAARYAVERALGDNAFGSVFLATDIRHGVQIVLTVVSSEFVRNVDAQQVLEDLGRIELLSHARLLPLHDFGQANGVLFYAQPRADGVCARDKLEIHGAAPIPQTIDILRDVAATLSYAHRHGVVHGQLSPDSVVFMEGDAVLANLGVAPALARAATMDGRSHGDVMTDDVSDVGPGQVRGASGLVVTSDVIGFGALGYELLTGRTPGELPRSGRKSTAQRNVESIERYRAGVPKELSEIVMKCLHGNAELRWDKIDEALRALTANSDVAPHAQAKPVRASLMERVGPYRILGVRGVGGMGVVYLAEQMEPVRRRVALKMIKLGMDTKEVLARFERERQALAVMSHPGIASVFDAGATESGRPYFVMEVVDGIPLTEYCDTNRLSTSGRLELFIAVCDAVQHAHQKGVLHRDLKPSNILVAFERGSSIPKVIDFGVAKAIGDRLTDASLATERGQLIGTPEYMSPEQAGMADLDVDTRTDVYALGVMLYELLVGTLPFDPRAASSDVVTLRSAIFNTDAPRPSARFDSLGSVRASVVRHRRTDVTTLRRELRRDLDWIVMKAIEKDRARRYQTVGELARDVQRHLDREPVQARPPRAIYRTLKFASRHKAGVATALALLAALVTGLAITTTLLVRVARAERAAAAEAATSQRVSEFLVGLFAVSAPSESPGESISARDLLDKGSAEITLGLDDQPLVQARLLRTMGNAYIGLGLYDDAAPALESALEIRRTALPEAHPDVAESQNDLANLYADLGRYEEAEELYQRALETREVAYGRDALEVAQTLNAVGTLYEDQGKYEEAEPVYERALAIWRRAGERYVTNLATGLNNAANIYFRQGRYRDADELYQEALTIRRSTLGPNHPDVAQTLNNLAGVHYYQGNYRTVDTLMRRSLSIYEEILGEDHPDLAMAMDNLGIVLVELEDYDEAESMQRRALEIRQAALGPEHPSVATSEENLGHLLETQGRIDGAVQHYRRALEIREKALGSVHPSVASALNNLAAAYILQQQYAAAEPLLHRSLAIWTNALGPNHPDVADAHQNLGELYKAQGRYDDAEHQYAKAISSMETSLGPENSRVAELLDDYADLLRKMGRAADADAAEARARSIRGERIEQDQPPRVPEAGANPDLL